MHLPNQALGIFEYSYLWNLINHRDLCSKRQLVALTTFSDLVEEAKTKVLSDTSMGNCSLDSTYADSTYADAIATYLALAVDKVLIIGLHYLFMGL